MTAAMPLSTGQEPRRSTSRADRWMAEMARAEIEALDATELGPLARSAALACAVPRWFNQDLMVALMGGMLSPQHAGRILETIRGWEFARSLGQGRVAYREGVREALLAGFEEGPALRALHERAQRYFERLINFNIYAVEETAWLRLSQVEIAGLREIIYHQLRLDAEAGYFLLRRLLRGAYTYNLPGEAEALLAVTRGADMRSLPPSAANELDFYEAVQQGADYRYEAAEQSLAALMGRTLDDPLRARALAELAKLYTQTGRLDRARELYSQAWRIWYGLRSRRELAAMSNNLGTVYLNMRDYRSARKHFEEALVDLRDVGSLGEQAQAYNNLAAAYEREEEWGRALEYYEASLTLKEQAGDRIGAARTKANIGSVHHARIRDIDDPPRAERMAESARKLYAESLETFEAYGARSEAAKVRYKQALLYYQNGEVDQARGLLPEVLREYRALRIPGVEVVENLAGRIGTG